MVQKIHPQGVIFVPSSRLMWADHQKKIWQQFRPYIKKSMCKYMYQVPREDGLVCVCIAITVYIGLLYPMSTTVKIWPWEPSVYYSSLRVCWPGKFLLHRMVINKTFILRFKKKSIRIMLLCFELNSFQRILPTEISLIVNEFTNLLH